MPRTVFRHTARVVAMLISPLLTAPAAGEPVIAATAVPMSSTADSQAGPGKQGQRLVLLRSRLAT